MNSTISTKIITYIILFWDVDHKSHTQFKHLDEKRLHNHNHIKVVVTLR